MVKRYQIKVVQSPLVLLLVFKPENPLISVLFTLKQNIHFRTLYTIVGLKL